MKFRILVTFSLLIHASILCCRNLHFEAYSAPDSLNTGIAVVVCPGGSYSWLDKKTEGEAVGKWLQSNGITAFVLHYRVASIAAYCTGFRVLGIGHKYPDMLEDVEQMLEYVYRNSPEYGIDTLKIGVMGFSAGGHLCMMSGLYNRTPYKPHFLVPVYPVVTMSDKRYVHHRSRRGALGVWRQLNKNMRDSLSIEKHISHDCPPTLLINCKDDPVIKYQNSELLDSALNAKHIPHTYLQYDTGGHGFGADDNKGTNESRQWKIEFFNFISKLYQR
ncbi:MAG: alpha/beta hydrolase [Paludibacteraceae bacterium]|nr:alpha/beta hydrolase [Paludibacteraceae bacterium]